MDTVKIRTVAMAVGIASTTAFGAWYGAGLKTEQDIKKKRRKIVEATPEEQLARLKSSRAQLVRRKTDLEKKIQELEARAKGQSNAD